MQSFDKKPDEKSSAPNLKKTYKAPQMIDEGTLKSETKTSASGPSSDGGGSS